ncbi:MAG: ParB/RepB/Spo0J family partition protein [bacterium]
MQKMSGLGRGLDSLIPSKKMGSGLVSSPTAIAPVIDGEVVHERVMKIAIDKVVPNPNQPRVQFQEDDHNDLIESIREHGIIQPLILTKDGEKFQIIAGERRWRAAKALNLPVVPAIVRDMTEQKKMEVALIENLQRKDLNPLETAMAYQKLVDEFNLTQEQLAKRVGKSRSVIANSLRLLTVHDDVKQAIWEGKLSEGHVRTLAGVPEEDQLRLLKQILEEKLSVRETEQLQKKVVVAKKIRKVNFDVELNDKIERLEQNLNTKVEIRGKGHGGEIVIKYYSEAELSELVNKISK